MAVGAAGVLALSASAPASARAQASGDAHGAAPQARAVRASGPIHMDGRLDERAGQVAPRRGREDRHAQLDVEPAALRQRPVVRERLVGGRRAAGRDEALRAAAAAPTRAGPPGAP